MTYSEICALLRRAGVESAEWDAQLLLEHFCGADRLTLVTGAERDYASPALEDAVRRRAAREPLQYLLGTWDFWRQTYEVSPQCLIPRPDTEILVEEAIRLLPDGAFFADLCTGSGCIAISVLAERPDTRALAAELSADALGIAQRNAERNGVSDRFLGMQADVLQLTDDFWSRYPAPDAILSNPPYIRTDVLGTLAPEVQREPQMALDGGADGLLFYRALTSMAEERLKPGGICLFEIGFDQGPALRELAVDHGFSCDIRRDYGGCERVAILRRNV